MLRAALIAMLSAGWLLPLALAANPYLGYLDLVIRPEMQGHVPLTSAPLDRIALIEFYFALSWLAAVTAGWSYVGYWLPSVRPNNSFKPTSLCGAA